MYFVLASAALAAFCLVLFDFGLSASFPVLLASRASRWSRLLSLRFAWFCMVLGWSLAVSAVLCGFMYFALVSAALAAFGLVLYGFGLVSAGFAVLYGFMYFVRVWPTTGSNQSAALLPCCSTAGVLPCCPELSWPTVPNHGLMYFALVSATLAAFGLVLYGFGLVSAGFAVLYGFVYFVLVAAALAAFCLVLGWSLQVSLFCAGFALLC